MLSSVVADLKARVSSYQAGVSSILRMQAGSGQTETPPVSISDKAVR